MKDETLKQVIQDTRLLSDDEVKHLCSEILKFRKECKKNRLEELDFFDEYRDKILYDRTYGYIIVRNIVHDDKFNRWIIYGITFDYYMNGDNSESEYLMYKGNGTWEFDDESFNNNIREGFHVIDKEYFKKTILKTLCHIINFSIGEELDPEKITSTGKETKDE